MPTKPLDRLMFAQGGLCFFCAVPLPKAEASVEHLVPSARAGSNSDDNCVACCKAMNALLGSMSLKEKIKVVLNQNGRFQCPNGSGHRSGDNEPPSAPQPALAAVSAVLPKGKPAAHSQPQHAVSGETISKVLDNLKSRGNSRPRHLSTLRATLKALASLKLTAAQVHGVIQQLQSSGKILVRDDYVTYKL